MRCRHTAAGFETKKTLYTLEQNGKSILRTSFTHLGSCKARLVCHCFTFANSDNHEIWASTQHSAWIATASNRRPHRHFPRCKCIPPLGPRHWACTATQPHGSALTTGCGRDEWISGHAGTIKSPLVDEKDVEDDLLSFTKVEKYQ